MEKLIFAIDPKSYYFYYWFLMIMAMVLGVVIYLLLRRPSMRRAQFAGLGKMHRTAAVMVSFSASVLIMWYAYTDSWHHFYRVVMKGDVLQLMYHVPVRSVDIAIMEGVEVVTDSAVRKGGAKFRIVLRDVHHIEYSSQLMPREDFDRNLVVLRKALEDHDSSD